MNDRLTDDELREYLDAAERGGKDPWNHGPQLLRQSLSIGPAAAREVLRLRERCERLWQLLHDASGFMNPERDLLLWDEIQAELDKGA